MYTGLRGLWLMGYAATLLGAPALGLSACAASDPDMDPSAADSHEDALGTAMGAASTTPCYNDCGCSLDQICSISTGATSGSCAPNPSLGFGPPAPWPICTATCQCQAEGNGLPYCVTGGCKATVPKYVPVSGSWNNPSRSGWGLAISNGKKSPLYTNLQIFWYTYNTSGAPIWFHGELAPSGTKYTGELRSSTYVSASQSLNPKFRGTMTLTPTSSTTATFSWTLDGIAGSEPVQHLAFGGAGATPPLTGQWFAYTPHPGSPVGYLPIHLNLFLDVQGSTAAACVGLYDSSGQPTWVIGSGSSSSSGFTASLMKVTGTNLYPGSTGTGSTSSQQVGSLAVQNVNAAYTSARFALSLPVSYAPQVTSTQYLSRKTN